MSELDKQIKSALNNNIDLTEEEYKEKVIEADKATAGHGITKKAAVSEAVRHKRIQSNFYGIALNFLSCILSSLENQTALLSQQNVMLCALCEKEGIDVSKLFRNTDE